MLRSPWVLPLLLAATATAQEHGAMPPDPLVLVRKLKDPKLEVFDRHLTVSQLVRLGYDGALPLFNWTRDDLRSRTKKWHRLRERHLRDFERAAVLGLRKRHDRRVTHRIGELQQQALSLSRGSGLSKEMIHQQLDPIVAELQGLLEIQPGSVLEDKHLAEDSAQLDADLLRLRELHDWNRQAKETLAQTDPGRRHLARQNELPSPTGLQAELEDQRTFLAMLATPMGERDRRVLEQNRALRAELDPEEYDGLLELNRIRLRFGLPVLAIDLKLCAAARGHSDDMRRLKFFSHTSPVPGKETPSQRAALAGTSGGAENIAAGQATGRGAIRAWWYSPGHHRNMMSSSMRVGLGRSESLWTQMFGR